MPLCVEMLQNKSKQKKKWSRMRGRSSRRWWEEGGFGAGVSNISCSSLFVFWMNRLQGSPVFNGFWQRFASCSCWLVRNLIWFDGEMIARATEVERGMEVNAEGGVCDGEQHESHLWGGWCWCHTWMFVLISDCLSITDLLLLLLLFVPPGLPLVLGCDLTNPPWPWVACEQRLL